MSQHFRRQRLAKKRSQGKPARAEPAKDPYALGKFSGNRPPVGQACPAPDARAKRFRRRAGHPALPSLWQQAEIVLMADPDILLLLREGRAKIVEPVQRRC